MTYVLDRYLLREIAVPFGVGLALFFVVVAFAEVLKVSDAVTGLGVSGHDILQALLYSLPPLLGLLIPVSSLFATLLGVGRLAADKELLAMCAGGVSPYQWLRVPLAWGLVLALLSGVATAVGEPWGIRGFRDLMARSAQRALAAGARVGEFNEWVPGVTFYAEGHDGKRMTDVFFADRRDATRPLVATARYGIIHGGERPQDLIFAMEDGTLWMTYAKGDQMPDPTAGVGAQRVIQFDTSLYRLDVGNLVGRKARNISHLQELSVAQLWQASRNPDLIASARAQITVILHRKFAVPLATVVFSLLAVPLAVGAGGAARARGFLFSSVLVALYYYVGRAGELSARGANFNAVLAAWLPDLLGMALLGVLLLRWRRGRILCA